MSQRWGTQRTSSRPWRRLRLTILERDAGRCTFTQQGRRCPEIATDVHHVISTVDGGSDDPDNLVSLCGHHHDHITAKHANAVQQRQRAKAKRPVPKHPGLK